MLQFLFNAPTAPLFVAVTYRGCRQGWVANGAPRSLASAQRLTSLAKRVWPNFLTRTIAA